MGTYEGEKGGHGDMMQIDEDEDEDEDIDVVCEKYSILPETGYISQEYRFSHHGRWPRQTRRRQNLFLPHA